MSEGAREESVVVRWLGHSCFHVRFNTDAGPLDVVTDPYRAGMGYPEISLRADVVTVSHRHSDHDQLAGIEGDPLVLYGTTEDGDWTDFCEPVRMKGVEFRQVRTYHDSESGARRGKNACFVLQGNGLTLVHLGDLGHIPTEDTASQMMGPHVLFVPLGGYFTIGAKEAVRTVEVLDPRIVIPMHYKTRAIRDWPISGPDDFLSQMATVRHLREAELSPEALPPKQETWVLDYGE